jgi:hypothetical protein
MQFGERDLAGWAELRAWQDDDRLGASVRRLRAAYQHGDRPEVRANALRLLVDIPRDYSAARDPPSSTAGCRRVEVLATFIV